jgi:ribosomal-protein-serine acetyltransferase
MDTNMPLLQVDEDIILKILELDDAEALFNLINQNRVHLREWLPWVDANIALENTQLFIQSSKEQHIQNLGFQSGIWFRGQLTGVIGFHRIDWINKNVEIGYWLGEEYQGHGIVTKACRTLVDYAFYEYKLNRIQIRCATGNKKSCAIIERLGFNREGTNRQAEFLYDHYVDLNVYSMTADEWKVRYNQLTKKLVWINE